jgi:hypothetical protein
MLALKSQGFACGVAFSFVVKFPGAGVASVCAATRTLQTTPINNSTRCLSRIIVRGKIGPKFPRSQA